MQTDNSTAVKWWNKLTDSKRRALALRYKDTIAKITFFGMADELEVSAIYEAEHPTENKVVGHTAGVWGYKIYDNDIFKEIEIGVGRLRTCVIPYLEAPAEANAQRIVTCVNGYDKLLGENKQLKSHWDIEAKHRNILQDENTKIKDTIASLEEEIKELKRDIQGYIEDAAGASL